MACKNHVSVFEGIFDNPYISVPKYLSKENLTPGLLVVCLSPLGEFP